MKLNYLFLLLILSLNGPALMSQTPSHHPVIPFMDDLVLVEEIDCAIAEPVAADGDTKVRAIMGTPCRWLVPSSKAAWFAYRLGSSGNLEPGKAYFLEVEYPDDTDRSFVIHNRGGEYNRGLQTGQTVGDALHTPYVNSNPESISLPHSQAFKKWRTLFWLHDHYAGIELPRNNGGRPEAPEDGFLVIISQFDQANAPMNKGAAVSAIRLYEAPDFETMKLDIHFPPENLPRRHLFFREEMSDGVVNNDPPAVKNPVDWYEYKAQLMRFLGMNTFSKDLLEFGHNQGWDPGPYNDKVNTSEKSRYRWGKIITMLQNYELDVLPYYEYAGTIGPKGLGSEKRARPLGDSLPDNHYTHISWTEKANADITDPDTYRDLQQIFERTIVRYKDQVDFAGAWLRPRPSANPVSFSDAAVARFSSETGRSEVSREALRSDDTLYKAYIDWWYGKRKEFLCAMHDYLLEEQVGVDPVVLYTTDVSETGKTHPDWQGDQLITDDPAVWEQLQGDYSVHSLEEIIASDWHLKAQLLPNRNWGGWEWTHAAPPPDPMRYKNTPGAAMTYTFNKAYTVGSVNAFETFRSASGLAIIRHYCLNEHAMEGLGYFVADVEWHDCYTVLAEARAMAFGDPRYIGYLAGAAFNRASLPYVRAFNANFLALPAIPSEIVQGAASDSEVVVRRFETLSQGTYLAIVNTGLTDKYGVVVSLPGECNVVDAATGEQVAEGATELKLDMYPAQLKSVILQPAE